MHVRRHSCIVRSFFNVFNFLVLICRFELDGKKGLKASFRMFFCAPEIKVATKLTGSNALINKRTLKIVFFIREYFIDRMILLTVKNTGTVKNTTEIKTSIFMPF